MFINFYFIVLMLCHSLTYGAETNQNQTSRSPLAAASKGNCLRDRGYSRQYDLLTNEEKEENFSSYGTLQNWNNEKIGTKDSVSFFPMRTNLLVNVALRRQEIFSEFPEEIWDLIFNQGVKSAEKTFLTSEEIKFIGNLGSVNLATFFCAEKIKSKYSIELTLNFRKEREVNYNFHIWSFSGLSLNFPLSLEFFTNLCENIKSNVLPLTTLELKSQFFNLENLWEALAQNTKLTSLNLTQSLRYAELSSFIKFLKGNATLKYLDLSHNYFTLENVENICHTMKHNATLLKVILCDIKVKPTVTPLRGCGYVNLSLENQGRLFEIYPEIKGRLIFNMDRPVHIPS